MVSNWGTIIDCIDKNGLFTDGDWIESKDQDPNGEIRLIQLADIGDGVFLDVSKRFVNQWTADRLRCTYLKQGDILVARMPDPLGRCCIFPLKFENKFITAVDVCIIRPSASVNNFYLQHIINSPAIRQKIWENRTGTTRSRITRKKLGQFKIPIPPLPEQRRIVAKLDRLFERIDKAIALVEQNIVSAQLMLASVLNEVFENTNGLHKSEFGDIVTNLDGKRQPIKASTRKKGVYPYYGASGIIDYVEDFIYEGENLLISEDGANLVMRTYPIAFIADGKYWVNNHAHVVTAKPGYTSNKYLELFFSFKNISDFITGAAQPKLSQKKLNEIPVPLPNLSTQKKIIDYLSKMKVNQTKIINGNQNRLNQFLALKSSLLDAAFRGEL